MVNSEIVSHEFKLDFFEVHRQFVEKGAFHPKPEVTEQLGHFGMTTVSAGWCVGKDRTIEGVVGPGDIVKLPGSATRAIRKGEIDGWHYRFYKTYDDYQKLSINIVGRNLVQAITAADGEPEFYFTDIDACPESGMAVMDVTVEEAIRMRDYGFGETRNVQLLPPSISVWNERKAMRNDNMHPDRVKRRDREALESAKLAHDDGGFIIVVNDQISETVDHVRAVALGHEVDESANAQGQNKLGQFILELEPLVTGSKSISLYAPGS